MIHDLIELYYYIKSIQKIDYTIPSWTYTTALVRHHTEINKVLNPITGELKLAIKVYFTNSSKFSQRIRIDPNRVVYEDSNYHLHVCNHEGSLEKIHKEHIITFVTAEEIHAIECIYDEINKLYERSTV